MSDLLTRIDKLTRELLEIRKEVSEQAQYTVKPPDCVIKTMNGRTIVIPAPSKGTTMNTGGGG